MFSQRYLKAFELTMTHEGSYSFDKNDPGGETMYGIAKNYWPTYWRNGRPTLDTARAFYFDQFWLRVRGDDILDERVALEVFDTAVNLGVVGATQIVQNCCIVVGRCSILDDGDFGPVTLRAVNACCDPERKVVYPNGQTLPLVERFLDFLNGAQLGRYIEKWEDEPSKRKYKNGWRNRCRVV